mgnify:CR=1 FL=1
MRLTQPNRTENSKMKCGEKMRKRARWREGGERERGRQRDCHINGSSCLLVVLAEAPNAQMMTKERDLGVKKDAMFICGDLNGIISEATSPGWREA